MALALATAGLGMIIGTGPDMPVAMRIVWLVIATGAVVVAIRSVRSGVIALADGVEIRGLWRTRHLPWSDIRRFDTRRSDSLIPWQVLSLERVDGRVIRLPEVASFGGRGNAGNLVAAAVDGLNAMRGKASP